MSLKLKAQGRVFAVSTMLILCFQNCSRVTFSDASQDLASSSLASEELAKLKPALATSNLTCILCHAQVQGSLISDLNSEAQSLSLSSIDFYASFAKDNPGNLSWINDHANMEITMSEQNALAEKKAGISFGVMTSLIDGKVYLPQRNILTSDLPGLTETNKFLIEKQVLHTYAPLRPASVAEHFDTLLNFRTPAYLEKVAHPSYMANKRIGAVSNAEIFETPSVKIGTLTSQEIADLSPNAEFTYIKSSNSSTDLKNFNKVGNYFTNSSAGALECDGDLIVKGPVVLNDLKLKSENGCRIYSTHTIFVQTSNENEARQAIHFSGGLRSQLQLASSTAILFGLGSCGAINQKGTVGSRLSSSAEVMSDFETVTQGSSQILTDAGNCEGPAQISRNVSIERVLATAPNIHSRYTGDFKGVLIAKNILGSLGNFKYTYDSVFSKGQILPAIDFTKILEVKECPDYEVTSFSGKLHTCK